MIVLFFYCVALAMGTNIPDGLKVCHKSDPNLGYCVGKFIEASMQLLKRGNAELGIPSLEPLFVEEIGIDENNMRSLSIQQKYHDVKVYGTTNSDNQMVDFDINKGCGWRMNVSIPMIRLEGDYELLGQLFSIPINAKGAFIITQHNMNNIHTTTCERYIKKYQTYIRLTNYTIAMKVESTHYNFSDIFPGNQQISEEIMKTINENGLFLFNEFKAGFESVFSYLQMKNLNNFLSKFPEDQLLPQ